MSRSPCARSSRSMPAQVGLEHRIAWKPTANADLRAAMGRLLPAVLTFQQGARRSSVVACPSRSATPRSRYGSKRFGVLAAHVNTFHLEIPYGISRRPTAYAEIERRSA